MKTSNDFRKNSKYNDYSKSGRGFGPKIKIKELYIGSIIQLKTNAAVKVRRTDRGERVDMNKFTNWSILTALTFAATMTPELGRQSVFAQQDLPAVVPQLENSSPNSGRLNVEEFLNEDGGSLGTEMGGDFFDRLQDADNLPDPEKAGNIPEPSVKAETEARQGVVIPNESNLSAEEPVQQRVESKDEPTSSDSSASRLPVTSGIPADSQTGNFAHYGANGPSLRRDIPVEAYGEDGFGNTYVGTGCGAFGGFGGSTGYMGAFENVRFRSNVWNCNDPCLMRAGAFFVDGSVSAGGASQKEWALSPALGNGTVGEINDSGNDFGLNQLYLSFGKEVCRAGTWSIGAQADLLYGTDYVWASSIGLESDIEGFSGGRATRVANAKPHWNKNKLGGYKSYGLAMPQAFAEIYAPWLSGFDLKLGHFYAPMGHEAVRSTKNFFYTHSYSFSYGMPHTFTGLLGDLKLMPGLSVQGGFSQGWDTWADNKGSIDVIGGLVIQANPCSSVSFFVNSGEAIVDNEFDRTTGDLLRYMTEKQTSYSLVYQRRFMNCWSWALEHDFGSAKNAAAIMDERGNVSLDSGNWYSVVNYLYYDVNPNMTLGFRFEWFKDRNYTRTIGDYAVNELAGYKWDGDNFYDFSLGLNWQIFQNVRLRPEVRYDFSDAKMVSLDGNEDYCEGVFDNFTDSKMWTVGGDLLVEF